MNAELETIGKILNVPDYELYRVTISWTQLEGWFFVYEGTPSYVWHNLKKYYETHLDLEGFRKMLSDLGELLSAKV